MIGRYNIRAQDLDEDKDKIKSDLTDRKKYLENLKLEELKKLEILFAHKKKNQLREDTET